ncbi:methyltransferase family protein [Stackebrandtia albiflava]|uniref:Methyltransferase family protein n=1 Tax=Stackebrandtia albiflava TaxID=406432 RepID=A0A562UQ27_9ACTN|nr:class I SAM-dependent methyltransferase [Stackebrandtia albiflava]TWJ07718.1 methyltransferase family protein [Stackebrandtia albiflava]
MTDRTTDPVVLGSAYADQRDLRARQDLYSHQHPRFDLPRIVGELIRDRLPRTPRVVFDIGCGNGTYLSVLRSWFPESLVVGMDLAPGMLAPQLGPNVVADAAYLPVRAATADVVLAMHMLYHVEEIGAATAEMHRVLAPGGIVVASSNARDDKAELDQLWTEAAGLVLGRPGPSRIALSRRCSLEALPTWLGGFTDIHTHHLRGTIEVTSPEPVLAHLASYRSFAEDTKVPFEQTVSAAERLLTSRIRRDGFFRITCHNGIVVATRQ